MPGVLVSNGRDIVRTGPSGEFSLSARPGDFILLTVPAGCRADTGLYRRVPPNALRGTVHFDFCLEGSPEQKQDNFSFVHIGDVHIHNTWGAFDGPADSERAIETDCQEINALTPLPEFVACAGDLANVGHAEEQYVAATRAFGRLDMPVVFCIGNHERSGQYGEEPDRVRYHGLYEHHVGPLQFAFEWGRYHFIVINQNRVHRRHDAHPAYRGETRRWLSNYLSLLDPKQPKIAFIHVWSSDDGLLDMLVEAGVKAVLAGHDHINQMYEYRGMQYYSTTSFIMAGSAISPRGFRIVHLKDGRITTEVRTGGVGRHLCVLPSTGHGAGASFEVRAYDTATHVESVACMLANRTSVALERSGKWGWTSTDERLQSTKEQTVSLKARDEKGHTWQTTSRLIATDGRAAHPNPDGRWLQFQGAPDRCGVASTALEPPLRRAWCRYLGAEVHLSSPVVDGRQLFVGVADDDTGEGRGLVAVDSVSGTLLWRFVTSSSVKHTPVIAGDTVVALTERGELAAVERDNGRRRWSLALGSIVTKKTISSPLLWDGKLYVSAEQGLFVCVDSATGTVMWRVEDLPHKGGVYWHQQSPSLSEGVLYAGSGMGIRAMDVESGRTIWDCPAAELGRITNTPVPGKHSLLFGTLGGTYGAIAKRTGKVVWKARTPGKEIHTHRIITGSAAYKDGISYLGLGNGEILALHEDSGEVVWRRLTDMPIATIGHAKRDEPGVCSSPVISGATLYIGANDGVVRGMDLSDGTVIWSCALGVPITSSAAVLGNVLYVADMDGHLYAFTAAKA